MTDDTLIPALEKAIEQLGHMGYSASALAVREAIHRIESLQVESRENWERAVTAVYLVPADKTVGELRKLKEMLHGFHLAKGGNDPDKVMYSARDVEFLVSVCLAGAEHQKAKRNE